MSWHLKRRAELEKMLSLKRCKKKSLLRTRTEPGEEVQTDLLLSGGVVLRGGFVERPLVVGVVIHPLTEMIPKVKAPIENTMLDCLYKEHIGVYCSL